MQGCQRDRAAGSRQLLDDDGSSQSTCRVSDQGVASAANPGGIDAVRSTSPAWG